MHLQQLIGMQSSKLGMWKGSQGVPFEFPSKMVFKRVTGWTSGRTPYWVPRQGTGHTYGYVKAILEAILTTN